jgi:RNA polymerase primary sigma factor
MEIQHLTNRINVIYNKNIKRYLDEISKYEPIPREEEAKLAKQIRKGSKTARNKLVNANLKFVVSTVCKYQGQGVALLDLINVGNIGLIKAALHFNEAKNFKFISYAVWHIRQSVLQHIADSSRPVKIPLHRNNYLYQGNKWISRLEQKHKRPITIDEVNGNMKHGTEYKRPYAPMMFKSFNAPVKNVINTDVIDMYIDDKAIDVHDHAEKHEMRDIVRELIEELPDREKDIVVRFFGFNGGMPEDCVSIGADYHVTRERIRQLRRAALNRLKHKILKPENKPILQELIS